MSTTVAAMQAQAEEFRDRYDAVREMIGRVIVGHDDIVHGVLTAILCGGHCLLEGVPGLGKTMLVRTLSRVLDLDFNRIQFTPDLMPADILGTNMIVEDADGRRRFEFQRGPVFTQILLADEINRATPKTQSAMLETMQEGTVTAAGTRFELAKPFFVLATQNPIEQEGTYPLPEAQLDRFLFKLVVGYSSREDLNLIVERTTRGDQIDLDKVMDGSEILKWQEMVRKVILAPHVQDYLVRLNLATHPDGPHSVDATNQYVRWGAARVVPKRWHWQEKFERYWKAVSTSVLRTCAVSFYRQCGTACCSISRLKPRAWNLTKSCWTFWKRSPKKRSRDIALPRVY